MVSPQKGNSVENEQTPSPSETAAAPDPIVEADDTGSLAASTDFLPSAGLQSTRDLKPDEAQPRVIDDQAREGLGKSIDEFGDLSGIVFNQQTQQLVTGHRRMEQINERWGPQKIELIDIDSGLHGIRVDKEHFFAVRVVDWSLAKQRAANVTANNLKIQGRFSDDLEAYLLEVRPELHSEGLSVFEEMLLDDLTDGKVKLVDVDNKPPPEFAWVLIGIPVVKYSEVAATIVSCAGFGGSFIKTSYGDADEDDQQTD